jgi:hypothetical protein
METHVKVVGLGNILYGGFLLCIAVLMFLGFGVAGLVSGDLLAGLLVGGIGLVAGSVVALVSLPRIIGGLGLLARKNWARYVLGATSVFGLLEFPIGTALSGYSLWVLFHDDTRRLTAG